MVYDTLIEAETSESGFGELSVAVCVVEDDVFVEKGGVDLQLGRIWHWSSDEGVCEANGIRTFFVCG